MILTLKRAVKAFTLTALAIFIIVSIESCNTKAASKDAESNKLLSLPVFQVDSGTAITVRDYLGTIEGKVNVEIRPQVEGILEKIYVDEGSFVKKDQNLFKVNELPSANADVGVAQAYRYPNLTIDATGGVNSMLAKNWVNVPGSLFGGLIGSITQPVFNRRKLKTNIEIAKTEREKAELDFQESVLQAINEVTNSLISLKKLREEDTIAKRRVEVAKLGVKQADLLFKAGHATYLEVITAQKNAIDSELELVSLQQQSLLAKVELYRALGGGWKE